MILKNSFLSGFEGIDIDIFKNFVLLYADVIVLFANNAEELQQGLDLLTDYCKKRKLKVNVS